MKTFYLFVLLMFVSLLQFNPNAFAEVTDEQLQQYISQTGLKEEDLTEYLSLFDLTIKDFDTIDELVAYLGEPVTQETLQSLLMKHSISKEELENILGGFGESIQDYLFIKDLEATVNFYLQHAEVLAEAEHMLSEIGLTQDEINNLFMHLLTLDETSLEKKMRQIRSDLEQYFSYNNNVKLSDEQQKELLTLYDSMIETFGLIPNYYLLKDHSKQEIAYSDLLSLNSLNGADLLIELYNQNNEYLFDVKVTGDMLSSDFILERGEKLLTVATLASEMSISVRGNKLPDTATPIGNIMLVAFVLILIGTSLLSFRKTKSP